MKNLTILILFFVVTVSCQSKEELFYSKIKLTDLQGEDLDPRQFKNKIVILNLWATWCGPCIKEMPDLVEMKNNLSEEFVLILASGESLDRIQQFKENRSFDLSFVQTQTSLESLGVYSLPTTFIIGKDGQLLETLVGARKWDSPEQIDQLKMYIK